MHQNVAHIDILCIFTVQNKNKITQLKIGDRKDDITTSKRNIKR